MSESPKHAEPSALDLSETAAEAGIDLADLPVGTVPGRGRIRSMPVLTKICAFWIVLIVLAAIFADWIPGLKDPDYQGFIFGEAKQNAGPSTRFLLGTDSNSRDLLARVVYGARVSLIVSMTSVAFGTVFGGLLGCFVGFVRGKTEAVIMATIDVILAFPGLVLLLTVVTLLQKRDLMVISLVIGTLSIPPYTRVARANALSVSRLEFVTAATTLGKKRYRILFSEIMPNVMPTVLAFALVSSAVVIVLEGALSFLGLSVQLPTSSWGNMINQSRNDLSQTFWPALWPSLALVFTVYSLNNVGDYLRRVGAVRQAAI